MNKDFFVADDVVVFDGGKDADFVEGVLDLFFGEIGEFDLFEGVDLVVFEALDLVDSGVCALAWVRWEVPSLEVMEKSFSDINYNMWVRVIILIKSRGVVVYIMKGCESEWNDINKLL